MVGPQTSLATLLSDFERLGLLDRGPIVEYTLGIPSGTFMVVHADGPELREEMRYLKMGDGPYYVIYRPEVLCHFAAPTSAAQAVLFQTATIAPRGAPIADVATFAKRDLHAGEQLDGIGGFDTYGMIVDAAESTEQGLLPMGLAEFACLTADIRKDEAVRYSAVRLEERQSGRRAAAPAGSTVRLGTGRCSHEGGARDTFRRRKYSPSCHPVRRERHAPGARY